MLYPQLPRTQATIEDHWRQTWPVVPISLIGVFQMFLSWAIVGFEIWSMLISIQYAFLFLGYLVYIFFTITWISTFTVVCCCRQSRGCATHALIQNILSLLASLALLIFDVLFLRNPWKCYLPGPWCYSWYGVDPYEPLIYFGYNFYDMKLIVIKAQLGCAIAFFVSCVVFLIIYVYTASKVSSLLKTVAPEYSIELAEQRKRRAKY